MAADFTEQEIETAVEKIVRSAIRRNYGSLGQRQTNQTFQDFQEQTIAVLTLTPSAPYYVVKLGTERLIAEIVSLSDTIEQLDDAVRALGRNLRPVASTTSLSNAKVAAADLAAAAGARGKAFSDISKSPAFLRLDRNISQFLSDYSAPNLRQGGEIVRTPEEGRTAVPILVKQLIEQRATLIEKVTSLSNALTDYEALNLPALLSSGVVTRASEVLAQRTEQLEQLTPETRVSVLRDVTLDLLAARTVIRNFGSLRSPTAFAIFEGSGQVLADTNHPATSATLTSDIPGDYPVHADTAGVQNQLDFLIDGTFRTVSSMGGGFLAELSGGTPEPYDIFNAGVDQNDSLDVTYDIGAGVVTVTCPLTAGTGRTVNQICADLNTVLAATNVEAEPAIQPLKFQGNVDIAGTDPGSVTFTNLNPLSSWLTIGIQDGDKLRVLSGTNVGIIYQVNTGGVTASVLTCTRLTGAGTTAETNQTIEVGGSSLTVKLKIKDSFAVTAMLNRWKVGIGGFGDPIKQRAAITLGLIASSFATSQPLTATQVASLLNQASTTALQDKAKLKVSVVTQPILLSGVAQENLTARTEPTDPNTVVIYKSRGRGSITAGTSATFTLAGIIGAIGDILAIRDSATAADIGKLGIITAVTSTDVTATFAVAVTANTNVLAEVLPDYQALGYGPRVVIADGANAGTYVVTNRGSATKGGLTTDKSFGIFQDFSAQPIFMTASLVLEYLKFSSTDTTLATAMQVDDGVPPNPNSGASLVFTTRPQSSVGTTRWFKVPKPNLAIEPGDILELFTTTYNIPTVSLEVASWDADNLLVQVVEPGIPVNLGTFGMSIGSGVPFARVRRVRHDTFDRFSKDAQTWLSTAPLQDNWLIELDRLVTQVLSEPNVPNINELRIFLIGLYGLLTIVGAQANQLNLNETIESIAEAYTSPVISEIDTLVESLHSQGADRAVDILLDAQFRSYFGLTQDGMSYAGHVLATTKAVVRDDLPVRSVRRKELITRQVNIGNYQEVDFEFDQSDIDNQVVPDSPLPNPASSDGDAY